MALTLRTPTRPPVGTSASKEKKSRGSARRGLVNLLFGRSAKETGSDAVDKASMWLDSVAAELDRGPDGKKEQDPG